MDEKAKAQEASTRKRAAADNDIFGTAERRNAAPKEKEAELVTNANEQQLIDHIRAKIAARGARGIMGIGKKFKIADDDGSHTLDKEEFKKAMHDFRIGLNPKQVA